MKLLMSQFLAEDFQTLICTAELNECAKKIRIDENQCRIPCEGIYTDFWKIEITQDIDELLLASYKNYKKFFETSNGKCHYSCKNYIDTLVAFRTSS